MKKQGKHGTLYLYEVTYTPADGAAADRICLWAYSAEHAIYRFCDPDAGWEEEQIQSVKRSMAHQLDCY